MSDKPNRARGLGRGLSALMADVTPDGPASDRPRRPDLLVPVGNLHPNPNQPRRSFDDAALSDLASSIREKGIIQPLIVRAHPDRDGHFEIVAGERRWRAAQIAQLHDAPVIVREYTDTEVLEVAIIENIQRSDLNAIDEAAGYRQLMERFGHTQEQLATALSKSRSHVANLMRLLSLPDEVQSHVIAGTLSAGHARALIGHAEAVTLAQRIVRDNLSVRDTERLVKAPAPSRPASKKGTVTKDADTLQIEQELSATLHMAVKIDHAASGDGGKVTLSYRSLEQLDDLLRTLSGG